MWRTQHGNLRKGWGRGGVCEMADGGDVSDTVRHVGAAEWHKTHIKKDQFSTILHIMYNYIILY